MSKHFDDAQGGGRASDRVRTHVEQQIRSGAWPVGGRVPTEAELAAELNVSGITVGRTLRRLAQEGVLVRRRGGVIANHIPEIICAETGVCSCGDEKLRPCRT